MTLFNKECTECGRLFYSEKKAFTCSKKCSRKRGNRIKRENYIPATERGDNSRRYKHLIRQCDWCGKDFEANANRTSCSDHCQSKIRSFRVKDWADKNRNHINEYYRQWSYHSRYYHKKQIKIHSDHMKKSEESGYFYIITTNENLSSKRLDFICGVTIDPSRRYKEYVGHSIDNVHFLHCTEYRGYKHLETIFINMFRPFRNSIKKKSRNERFKNVRRSDLELFLAVHDRYSIKDYITSGLSPAFLDGWYSDEIIQPSA